MSAAECWKSRSARGRAPDAMATQSSSIGTAIDLWGYKWDVKEDRPTLYGWPVRLG